MEQYYYLAEIVGVVAVIASLVYVGRQLSLNTKQLRAQSSDSQALWAFDAHSSIARDEEFSDIWVRGGKDFESLSEVEKERLLLFEMGALMMWSHISYLEQAGMSPEHVTRTQDWAYKHMGKRQSIRVAWSLMEKEAFNPEFTKKMARHLQDLD